MLPPDAPRGGLRTAACAVLVALLLQLVTPLAAVAGPTRQPPADPPRVEPVQIVVLVDVSGSLSPEDVARERDAVRVIVQGEPSDESTVSVFGFGSSNTPGQSPVDEVCPATTLESPAKRDLIAECVGNLQVRTAAMGADTDHVAALEQAQAKLASAPPDQPKIVYLLTDGVLDVGNSPR